MVNTASTDGDPTIFVLNPSRIEAAETVLAAAAVKVMSARSINMYDFRFFIRDKQKNMWLCLLEQPLDFVGSHKHIAGLGSLGRTYNAHLLHFVHEASGLVEADLELALQTRDRGLCLR